MKKLLTFKSSSLEILPSLSWSYNWNATTGMKNQARLKGMRRSFQLQLIFHIHLYIYLVNSSVISRILHCIFLHWHISIIDCLNVHYLYSNIIRSITERMWLIYQVKAKANIHLSLLLLLFMGSGEFGSLGRSLSTGRKCARIFTKLLKSTVSCLRVTSLFISTRYNHCLWFWKLKKSFLRNVYACCLSELISSLNKRQID